MRPRATTATAVLRVGNRAVGAITTAVATTAAVYGLIAATLTVQTEQDIEQATTANITTIKRTATAARLRTAARTIRAYVIICRTYKAHSISKSFSCI